MTREERISGWIKRAKKSKSKYIIDVHDSFSNEYYPVFCDTDSKLEGKLRSYRKEDMLRVYDIIEVDESLFTKDNNIYRKKPIEIDAMLWTGENIEEITMFIEGVDNMKDVISKFTHGFTWENYIEIVNGDGLTIGGFHGLYVKVGYYLIKEEGRDFCICSPEVFKLTYDKT